MPGSGTTEWNVADVSYRCCILKAKGVTTNNNPKNNPRRNSFTQPELPQRFDFITRLTQGERSISATSTRKRVASVFKKKKGLKGAELILSCFPSETPPVPPRAFSPPATAETRDEPRRRCRRRRGAMSQQMSDM